MAATRLIPMHVNKGKTLARCIQERTDYAKNPEKTEKGELVTAYGCDPMTVEEDFLLAKNEYQRISGRQQKNDVIAYQIRQSFKPGEITPEEANKVGYELAMRFTKGKHQFIVATHTDRAHVHNHIVFNSTTIDCQKKFRNFFLSSFVLQKVSDIICVEHGLSIIDPKPYGEREKQPEHPKRESFRDILCGSIDDAIARKPEDFAAFLKLLEQDGYEIKYGKHTAVRGKGQQRFIRFRSLGEGYTEEDIRAVILGQRAHRSKFKSGQVHDKPKFNLLLDIDAAMREKGVGYQRWATVYNLKQMAQTMLFIRDHGIESMEQLAEKTDASSARFDTLDERIKSAEKRLTEIAELKKHIINYSKTRDVYVDYRKAGYSKKFFEEHREAITLHKAAKDAFDRMGVKKLPRIKELNAEYAEVLAGKKKDYAEYRKARDEMREYQKAKKNVEVFFQAQSAESVKAAEKSKREIQQQDDARRQEESQKEQHEKRQQENR